MSGFGEPFVAYDAHRDAEIERLSGRVRDLEAALRETEDDALALLDQHVSPEVHKETRRRIIERIQARAAGAPAEKPPA